jgi:hypothetical protein
VPKVQRARAKRVNSKTLTKNDKPLRFAGGWQPEGWTLNAIQLLKNSIYKFVESSCYLGERRAREVLAKERN